MKTIYTPIAVSSGELPEKIGEPEYKYTDLGLMWFQHHNKLWYFPGQSIAGSQPAFWLKKRRSTGTDGVDKRKR